jgi:ribosomal protein S18 acetylase RimI-like enzyme
MIDVHLQIRPAIPADQQQIANLISFQRQFHRHQDWHTPLEWLGCRPYIVLEKDGYIAAALACPPDPPSIFWIRLFIFDSNLSGSLAWSLLWDAARDEITSSANATVAAITIQNWFESILIENKFVSIQNIVMLQWIRELPKPQSIPTGILVRPMNFDDLPHVAKVDAAAFEPLWQNSLSTLSKAFSHALYASVAEDKSGVVGYQLSTGNRDGAHLARLAVQPKVQKRRIASALIGDLIKQVCRNEHLSHITVNTQSDNTASLALYEKIGFQRTGEQYPIYIYREGD